MGSETVPPRAHHPPRVCTHKRTRTNDPLHDSNSTTNRRGEHTPRSQGGLTRAGDTRDHTNEPRTEHGTPCRP
eukprot:6620178-Pyramimonas_sp.AAC.1